MNNQTMLVHPFINQLPDVDELFLVDRGLTKKTQMTINTVNAFCDRVDSLSIKYAAEFDQNTFKGDALELFAEYLIKTNESDNRIGIYGYTPVHSTNEQDIGVDGFGKGENGNPATVQVKFRHGGHILTDEDGLSRFSNTSLRQYGVKLEDTKNMLLITTGNEVSNKTMEITLFNACRVLNREALRQMLDNRPEWWNRFYTAVKDARTKCNPAKSFPVALRNHQTEAIMEIFKNNKNGKIILPTGTGKTLVEAEAIRRVIITSLGMGKIPVIKVNSPRILLCFQLFEEVYKYLLSHGVNAMYVNYNSGNASDKSFCEKVRETGSVYTKLVSTTSPHEVKIAHEKAIKNKMPLIVFSTYHSSEKFATSKIVPDLTIHDEAHNLVSTEFSKVVGLPSDRNLFFTATEKNEEDAPNGLGMDNPTYFGDYIYTKSPATMIKVGEMIAPHVHIVKPKDGIKVNLNKLDSDHTALFMSISDAFFAHQKKIWETSIDPDMIGAKVLVVCRGQNDLIEMFKTEGFEDFRKQNPNVYIFALSSEFGIYDNGEYIKSPVTASKKFSLIKKLKGLSMSDKAIIFHVDMIGEGIDVPGITGVMPFRNCELSKFVQNIGRASRLHVEDRKKVYSGELNNDNKSKWIKPYSWVIIPSFLENSEGFSSRFQEIIDSLRTDYGYIPKQDTFIDNVRGLVKPEEIDTVNEVNKNKKHGKSGLTAFKHEFEELSVTERIIHDNEVANEKTKAADELKALLGKWW